MDYRHTEDFARRMEAAALHGHALRRQAVDAFWKAAFAGLGRAFRALWRRVAGAGRADKMLPEA